MLAKITIGMLLKYSNCQYLLSFIYVGYSGFKSNRLISILSNQINNELPNSSVARPQGLTPLILKHKNSESRPSPVEIHLNVAYSLAVTCMRTRFLPP